MSRAGKKTRKNPHGLTGKQKLMVDDMSAKIKAGKPATPVDSVKKIYNVSTEASASAIASRNVNNPNIRAALMDSLYEKEIIGPDGKVEQVLEKGLDAVDKENNVDYTNRLRYAQEINKISGMYAPQQVEKKSLHLSMDITEDELDKKIQELKDELEH